MKRVVVVGASGYIGRYIVAALKERGHWVRALCRSEARLRELGPFKSPAIRTYCDDVYIGEATRPDTLKGLCDGVDGVISSLGLSRQRDGLTFDQVDHQANRNVVELAERSGVPKFVYVSLWDPGAIENLEITRAHEKVVERLRASRMRHTIVRPSGYFSDMGVLLDMAKSGLAFIVGKGENRMNPIHGRDVGRVAADALESEQAELGCGGPDVFTQNQAAELAFEVLGKKPRLLHLPVPALDVVARGVRIFNRQFGDLAEFLVAAGQVDAVAPQVGVLRLRDYFEELNASRA